MLNAIQGGKFMHIAKHGVKLYSLSHTWSEALCSLLEME